MKSDSYMDKLEKIGSYSARSLAPGILSNIDRIIKANEGYISETGRSYDSGDEIKAMLTGWRKQKLDPRTSFDFASRRAVSDMGDAAQQFSQPYRAYQNNATGYNEQLLVDASEKVNAAQFKILQDLREQYMAAVKLGARPEELKTQMWKNGVPQRMIFSITQNYYLPFAGPGFGWTVENGEPKLRTPGKDYALKHFVLGRAGPLGKTVEGSVKWLGRELDRKTP